jgi:group I intron endonuclease
MKGISGIYKLHWPKQGYYYFGQSINLRERKIQHFCAFRKNRHYNQFMQRLYDKYGLPDFLILETCEWEELDKKEQTLINQGWLDKMCCNVSPSSGHSQKGIKRTETTKERCRQAKKGRKLSISEIENCRNQMLKRYAEGKGPKPLIGNKNGFYKKKHDLITKIIMSNKKQGIYDLGKNPRARLTINLETGIYYDTIKEAAIAYNINERTVRSRIHRNISNIISI